MPKIRNQFLIKRFTDYFKLKINDFLSSEAGQMVVPVVNLPIPVNAVEIIDTAANDSDKTITVPDCKQWKILYGRVRLVTTATVGDRQMEMEVRSTLNSIFYRLDALNVQIASTTEAYNLGQFSDVSESVALTHLLPIPVNLIIKGGGSIRFRDSASVDAAADDLTVRFMVEESELTSE